MLFAAVSCLALHLSIQLATGEEGHACCMSIRDARSWTDAFAFYPKLQSQSNYNGEHSGLARPVSLQPSPFFGLVHPGKVQCYTVTGNL